MFSNFDSPYPSCSNKILKREVIVKSSATGKWVHVKCFSKEEDQQGQLLFAISQRCRTPIEAETDAEVSICGGVTGHKYIKCPNKRKVTDLQGTNKYYEEDSEVTSSQGSSTSSSSSTPKKTKH